MHNIRPVTQSLGTALWETAAGDQSDPVRMSLDMVSHTVTQYAPQPGMICPESALVLLAALAQYDADTYLHSLRVANMTWHVAWALEYSPRIQHRVWVAALLHDIGMINVPRSIVRSTGGLAGEQRWMMMRHPVMGAQLVGIDTALSVLVPAVIAHHERPDGRGYPQRLRGSQIPADASLVAAADAADRLLRGSQLPGMVTTLDVCGLLCQGAGSVWDATVAHTLAALLYTQRASGGVSTSPTML